MDVLQTLTTITFLLILPLLITHLTAKLLITNTTRGRLTSRDLHKRSQPEIPLLGGVSIFAGIALPLTLVYITTKESQYLTVTASLAVITFIGLLDDLYEIKQSSKVALTAISSIPLLILVSSLNGTNATNTTILGHNLGIFYYPFITIGVTGATNATNLLAGFNGLETGLSAIATSGILISALITNNKPIIIIAIISLGSLLSFLHHNRYKAKIFPGNVGSLQLGSILACMVILGKMEYIGPILVLPHIIDLLYKSKMGFKMKKLGSAVLSPDGTLDPPPYPSLLAIVMRRKRVTEPQLVSILWRLETLCVGIAIIIVHVVETVF